MLFEPYLLTTMLLAMGGGLIALFVMTVVLE
jgi:hypothetical protein